MNRLLLVCLIGACAVMAAPLDQNDQEVADLMNAGLKLMAAEGRLDELKDDNEIQMLDLKQVCSTACAMGGQALDKLCAQLSGWQKILCNGAKATGPAACAMLCGLIN
jgi:hypothetical protein